MASKATDQASEPVPRRRACDECRSRKLACTKEPEGCSRCKKEGITCHYSPQKPMGRPRKRRYKEEKEEAPRPPPHTNGLVVNDDFADYPSQLPFGGYGAQVQPTPPLDPSLNFLVDNGNTSMEFLDLLPNDYSKLLDPSGPQFFASPEAHDGPATSRYNLGGGDLLGGIDFGAEPSYNLVSRDLQQSLHRYLAEQVSNPLSRTDSTPPHSAPGSDQSSLSDLSEPIPPSMRMVPIANCNCLASLYLALESLTHLPPDVVSAMRVARNASRAAHDVIDCPSCSNPLVDDPLAPPPIQSFQNLMFLGTLVPSACNAYAQILEMVDNETALAKAHGRTFWFSFKNVGGLWGQVGGEDEACSAICDYDNRNMTPDMWRLTIRALLRLDIYGMQELDPDIGKGPPYTHRGLKGVVRILEERSLKRHAILDELVASGQLPKSGPFGVIYPNKPCPPSQRNCIRMLETARTALDNLIIA